MSEIVIASEYTSVHTKNWTVPPKPEPMHVERRVKGDCKIKLGPDGFKRTKAETRHFSSPDEMLKSMWKDTDQKLESFRYPDQRSFTNSDKQTGKGMWSNDLVARVTRLNPKLFVEDSLNVPGCAGFYKMVDGQKATAGVPNASFRRGFMPEFTIMTEDAAALAVGFNYGWRQVLLRLVKSKDLTYSQITKVWGEVHYGDERAKHYYSNLGNFRS